MRKEFSFNFCIIPNPFASGGRNMIFMSKSGEKFLDKKTNNSKEYEDVKDILEQFGYTETGHLQFESSNNSNTNDTMSDMRLFLEDCGLNYSRELEVTIVKDLSNLKEEMDNSSDFAYDNFDGIESPIKEKTKNKLIESKSELFDFEYTIPELDDKVSLYFYLFLEFGFNAFGRPMIQFGGDFKDSSDYDDRNYIKIVKSDFERIFDPKKPNAIVFSSIKKQKDFLKEAGMLYSGYFKYQKKEESGDAMILREEKHIYKLADVKMFLNPDQPIVVETNKMGYDRLIKLSKKIKVESTIESNKSISIEEIEQKAKGLTVHLTKKMKILSDKEEFEAAAGMKKDVDFIEGKIEFIKEFNKPEITTGEYFKLFCMP